MDFSEDSCTAKLRELEKELQETKAKLNVLLENIPGGVMTYDAESGKFEYISPGCLSIFHCTEEEFREHCFNCFDMMVMKQDRVQIREQVANQISFFETVELTYRVQDLMDNIMWIYHKGRLMEMDGKKYFLAVISDVTEEKLVQAQLQQIHEQLYMETERYKLIEEAVDNIQFDFDICQDRLTCSAKDAVGNPVVIAPYSKSDVIEKTIHEEDRLIFLDKMQKALLEPQKGVMEYRSRLFTDEYVWYRLNYASFSDKSDRVVRMVGSAKDITQEKAEQEVMRSRIETDAMTGLLNKEAVRLSVINYIENADIGICHALLMIDVDHFKAVNDTFGHMYGDQVIGYAADTIRAVFRETDFVGRVGGDEFLVFMKHTTPAITEERADRLNEAMRHTFTMDGQSVEITCSIGIAFFGRDGEDFDTLFRKADNALYDAKRAGKNQFRVYYNK